MKRLLILSAIAGIAAFAADDPWTKVKELKSGSELRVYKRGSAVPIEAKFDELRDDALSVVVKNTQQAIPKDQVDRVDARPASAKGPKMSTTTTAKQPADPNAKPAAGMNHGAAVPGDNYSTSTTFGSGGKPTYETIYRRMPPPPAPKQ